MLEVRVERRRCFPLEEERRWELEEADNNSDKRASALEDAALQDVLM